jgi:hypothetical protein
MATGMLAGMEDVTTCLLMAINAEASGLYAAPWP